MSDIRQNDKKIEELRSENEELDYELSRAQKKAAIKAAKRQYGKDWKEMLFGTVKAVKINAETLHTLHSMGVGNDRLRDYNDPRSIKHR